MAELAAASPLAGLDLPLAAGACRLLARPASTLLSVAPFRGRAEAVSAALRARLGIGLTAPGRWEGGGPRVLWMGLDLWFVEGADGVAEALEGTAAVTDQTDGWAGLRLEGGAAADVLARLVPIDLDAAAFPPGGIARTPLHHVAAALIRTDAGFDLLVMRSFARTAHHELAQAMRAVAARAALTAAPSAV